VEGKIWPTENFWRSAPNAKPLAGFIPAASRGEGEGEGMGEERKGRRGARMRKSGRKVGTGPPIGYIASNQARVKTFVVMFYSVPVI